MAIGLSARVDPDAVSEAGLQIGQGRRIGLYLLSAIVGRDAHMEGVA